MKGVVCSQPRAADVGAAILANGGNAFDAAVATAFSQMVSDPFMCGIGGMGTLHYHRADEGRSGMVDFYTGGLGLPREYSEAVKTAQAQAPVVAAVVILPEWSLSRRLVRMINDSKIVPADSEKKSPWSCRSTARSASVGRARKRSTRSTSTTPPDDAPVPDVDDQSDRD